MNSSYKSKTNVTNWQFTTAEADWNSDIKTVEDARRHLRGKGAFHNRYSFYTNVDRVVQMLETGYLWLTRLDSELFDDGIEHTKYGKKSQANSLFVKCFQFGTQESAAMWGLYCPPTYKAIRVTVSCAAFGELASAPCFKTKGKRVCKTKVALASQWVQDIFYAVVHRSENDTRRENTLWHDGEYTNPIKNLQRQISNTRGTGVVKDIEWRFEDEARLYAKTRKPSKADHIAVELPDSFMKSMSFVFSPWSSEQERKFVKTRIIDAFENGGRTVTAENAFSESALQDGLKLWARRLGAS